MPAQSPVVRAWWKVRPRASAAVFSADMVDMVVTGPFWLPHSGFREAASSMRSFLKRSFLL
ncbi:hypothetical protein GCM10009801_45560 [Streptomyces albiaxialis]|uniref:Uncharacterized protein n=1 Tax=Streptomyces albiaxialis TaxID=329523 RepID=A0ABP5HQV5_9ACTN